MAEAHTKNHDYHLVDPSPWPLVGSISATIMAIGAVLWMKAIPVAGMKIGPLVFGFGTIGVLYTMAAWWVDVIREAEKEGHHTRVVQLHHRYGMIMFIASEVMFFVDPWHLPLLNTLILLTSGTTVTWAHYALLQNDRAGLKQALWLTVALGVVFTICQAYEYAHATFAFSGNIYGSTFFMATGFHGFHVIIGTIFLAICLWRVYLGHFKPQQHLGFEFAAWYWHFVDVVWLFLFAAIYVWGAGHPAAH